MNETKTAPLESGFEPPKSAARALLWVHPTEQWCPLSPGTTLIGRADDAGIRITGSQVSRRHATITVSGARVTLRDEGSRNKVRCNLSTLPECQVSNNDIIRIGDWVGILVEGQDAEPGARLFHEHDGGGLVGPRSQSLWRTVEQVAPSALPIVIEGETGTGKEVVARALHGLSGRSGPFVAVNCAAQPENLFEALFFGHAKSAFTGAQQAAEGFFVAADGGTLFLDELLELTPTQQAKVLRVVEEGRVTPVGATQSRAVDVRIVSATQRPLGLVADEGKFRADLYARLNGLTLRLLPLSLRKEEVPRLFLRALARAGATVPRLSAGFVERLCSHPWKLNVRELVTIAARIRALYPNDEELAPRHLAAVITPDPVEGAPAPLPQKISTPPGAIEGSALGARTQAWLERHRNLLPALAQALVESRGNVSEAARRVGISRPQAQRLLDAAAQERGE